MSASIEEITAQTTKMVRAKTGDPGARISEVSPLPGHAGFGYSFLLERTTSGGTSGKLVLRVAPEGVRIAGPADVVRQARIMKSLADTDVPVPPILWYGDEAEFFGRPYFVDGFVDGFKLADVTLPRDEARAYARTGIETLAALHRVPWAPRRDAWGSITELSEEMKRLDHLLDRDTLDPKVVARGTRVAREAALVAAEEPSRRHRARRLPVFQRAVQGPQDRHGDRLGNLDDWADAARPRMGLFLRGSGQLR
jgi:hypothetical protein